MALNPMLHSPGRMFILLQVSQILSARAASPIPLSALFSAPYLPVYSHLSLNLAHDPVVRAHCIIVSTPTLRYASHEFTPNGDCMSRKEMFNLRVLEG
jgi:hypothetical protein